MKKIISVLATAAVAMTMVMTSCSMVGETTLTEITWKEGASTSVAKNYDKNGKQIPRKEKVKFTKVTLTGLYAGPQVDVKDGWTKLKIEFIEVPSNCQFVYNSNVTNPSDQWGNPFCAYSGQISEKFNTKVIELDLTEVLSIIKTAKEGTTEATAVKNVIFQNTAASNTLKIKSVTATKADGSTETAKITAPGWGGSQTEVEETIEILD